MDIRSGKMSVGTGDSLLTRQGIRVSTWQQVTGSMLGVKMDKALAAIQSPLWSSAGSHMANMKFLVEMQDHGTREREPCALIQGKVCRR